MNTDPWKGKFPRAPIKTNDRGIYFDIFALALAVSLLLTLLTRVSC